MCLIVRRVKKELKPRTSRKDIVCYKIMKKSKYGEYVTPYREEYICNEIVNGEYPMCAQGEEMIDCFGSSSQKTKYQFHISSGFIHTFESLDKAIENIKNLNHWLAGGFEVFRCIIPKGTVYYVGEDGWRNANYASKEIVFKGKVFVKSLML